MSAQEACAFLGILPATLYAYVSRGKIGARSEGGQKKRYARADLLRLRAGKLARSGHGPVAASAMHFGQPVLATSICEISPEGPRYRGALATELVAAGATFADVTALLLGSADAPMALTYRGPMPPKGTDTLLAYRFALVAAATVDEKRVGVGEHAQRVRAYHIARLAPALASSGVSLRALRAALRADCQSAAFLAAHRLPMEARPLVDAALILIADHELNPSTFAARIAAGAGADLYACTAAALAVLSGSRHGATCTRIDALVREVGRPSDAAIVIRRRLHRGSRIPGFGHTLYPDGDPRGAYLLRLAADHRRNDKVEVLRALAAAMALRAEPAATVDLGLLAVAYALGLGPMEAEALFAVGRTVGWLAHAIEQGRSGTILRPRAFYQEE